MSKIPIWLCKEWSHFNMWKILMKCCDPRFVFICRSRIFWWYGWNLSWRRIEGAWREVWFYFFGPWWLPATIRVSWLVSEWIVAHCPLRILGGVKESQWFPNRICSLFLHASNSTWIVEIHWEMCKIWWAFKVFGGGGKGSIKMKNLKTHEKNPTNMNRPFLSHTQWANNWQLSNTYPSSNTMSMQTEHFLLNKCSHLWVWFLFKLKLNRKSMDMNITMFVKL